MKLSPLAAKNVNRKFPWYDSLWLATFRKSEALISENCPERLTDFVSAFEKLRTRDDFVVSKLKEPILNAEKLEKSQQLIKDLTPKQFENHEFIKMGRQIVHNHDYFNALQIELCDRVSEIAGESLEPYYNFLSLYNNLGVCEVHMDSPEAKWTLDVCIDQSARWPIYFSQVRPWPEQGKYFGKDWQQKIKSDSQNKFSQYILNPGDGLVFSGSSQWHYRDRMENKIKRNYCHLVFFHYVPKGSKHLMFPNTWAKEFDLPILKNLE